MTTTPDTNQRLTDETIDIHWVDSTLRGGMDHLPSLFGDSEADGVHTDDRGDQYIRITKWTEDGHIIGYTRMYVTLVDEENSK